MFPSNTIASQSDMRQRINVSGLANLASQQQASTSQRAARPEFISMPQLPVQSNFGLYRGVPSPAVFQQQPSFSSPGVAATNCYSAGFVPNQQRFYNQGRSQPTFSPYNQGGSQPLYPPGVAATNGFSAGVFPQQQQQFNTPGRSQPMYAPGVAATNCFPTGNVPYQQQVISHAQAYGGQYSQAAFNAPAQSPFVAQNVASTFAPPHQQVQQQQQQQQPERDIFEYVDLTREDEEEKVQTPAPAPVAPDVSVSAAQQTGLFTPASTPSLPTELSTSKAPDHLCERLNHLRVTIKERDYPCAFRLLRSFEYMKSSQKRKYCSLFWHSNEEAHEDLLNCATLSPEFSVIYYMRTSAHAKRQEPMTEEELEKFEAEVNAACAELERTCKAKLQDRIDEENLSNLHQAVTTTKGKKSAATKAARLEEWEEENERTQEEKRKRWAKLDGIHISNQPAVTKRKRVVGEVAPAPAPKRRGRPPKVRAVEEGAVVKEKKKRGRPRKNPVVQEPTPDHAEDAEDDGTLEAELFAGLSEDVVEEEDDGLLEAMLNEFAKDDDAVDESATVEPSRQLQGHEDEGCVAAAIIEDLPAACSDEAPADESAVVVASLPEEHADEAPVDTADFLAEIDSTYTEDLGMFELDNLMNSEAANDIEVTLNSIYDME
ncbi:hypothetical protein G6011_04249 [Alternaria panax]|uniref:Uncharacterized protein n=1 Tax=Alternaria panax TaxID=48097 RepID=A0AAD4NU10_9PLEO|nr:hypothetical protein G6011_04249 [Alternaria panax]